MFLLNIDPWYRKGYERFLYEGNPQITLQSGTISSFRKWLKLQFNCKPNFDTMYLEFNSIEAAVDFKLKVIDF